jgi:hypothetical protein
VAGLTSAISSSLRAIISLSRTRRAVNIAFRYSMKPEPQPACTAKIVIWCRGKASPIAIKSDGAPDMIRTCSLYLRRANANQPCYPPPTEIEGLGQYLDEPRWIP